MKLNAGKISELEEGTPSTIRVAPNFQIVLIRKSGRIFALNDACPHMEGPLGEGEIQGHEIVCPWHFWRFNIETGECTGGGDENATCYPVTVEDETIIIDVPDSEL